MTSTSPEGEFIRTLEQGLAAVDGCVVVLDREGELVHAGDRARTLLRTYFGGRNPVPKEITAWLRRASDSARLVTDRHAGQLIVRTLPSDVLEPHRVLVLEELRRPIPTTDSLRALGLTPREADVLRLVAIGKDNDEIGGQLNISPATVRKHLERVYPKLGVKTRAAAAAYALGYRSAGVSVFACGAVDARGLDFVPSSMVAAVHEAVASVLVAASKVMACFPDTVTEVGLPAF